MGRLGAVVRAGEDTTRLLVLLPGYGDRAGRFAERIDRFDPQRRWTVVVLEGLLGNDMGPYWYDVDGGGPVTAELDAAVSAVRHELAALAVDHGIEQDDIVLAGFSQGGALALAVLCDPGAGPPPAAVAVLAGYLPSRPDGTIDLERAAGRPVLLTHGADDEMVEAIRGRSAAKALQRAGARVAWFPAEGGHRFDGPLLDGLRDWLDALDRDEPLVAPI